MVGIGIALPPPSLHEIKLESDMFVFRTSLDLTIIHCENRYVQHGVANHGDGGRDADSLLKQYWNPISPLIGFPVFWTTPPTS